MRLPKNPKQYVAASFSEISFDEVDKVVWHILNGKYRTIKKETAYYYPLRKIRLPDGTIYTVFHVRYHEGRKRSYCGVGEERLYDIIMEGNRQHRANLIQEDDEAVVFG